MKSVNMTNQNTIMAYTGVHIIISNNNKLLKCKKVLLMQQKDKKNKDYIL